MKCLVYDVSEEFVRRLPSILFSTSFYLRLVPQLSVWPTVIWKSPNELNI